MDSPIVTRKLSRKFRHSEAVHSLDLEVPSGSIYGLIGPNGAGKTTSIKLMMNILRPSSGTAEVLGVDSRRLSPRQFERIGYVSENQELPEEMTVEYFLRYLKPFYPTWDGALADELVRQFGLPANRRLAHLSRGMRMKAALRRRSLTGPNCWFWMSRSPDLIRWYGRSLFRGCWSGPRGRRF